MRIFVETPFHAFEAVTVYPDVDLDGDILAIDEYGDAVVIHGHNCTIEVLDDASVAPRPANVTRRWVQVERDMLACYPDPLPPVTFPEGWDALELMAA